MNSDDTGTGRLSKVVAVVSGVLAAGFGIVALLGWSAGIPLLTSFGPGWIPMAPSTALLFLLFGPASLLLGRSPLDRAMYWIGLVIGSAGTLAALLLFFLSSLGIYPQSEHLGLGITGTVHGLPIGHMSPLTAFCFVLAGLSFLASLSSPSGNRVWSFPALGFASLMVLTTFAVLLSYLLGSPVLYSGSLIPPALPTSLAFLILGTGLLASSMQRIWPRGRPADAAGTRAMYVLILVFVALALGIVTTGYLYSQYYEKRYRGEVERQLSAISLLKAEELERWREERLADAAMFYGNENFAGLVRRYLEAPDDSAAESRLRKWLILIKGWRRYDRVSVLDTQGLERIEAPDTLEPAESHLAKDAAEALQTGNIKFLDFHRDSPDGPVFLELLVPLYDERDGRRPLGVLQLKIDPEHYLYPMIRRWPTPSRTAETLLVRREGDDVLFLNELRFQKNTALTLRSPLSNSEQPAVMAALGRRGIVEGVDYRGVPVLAALRAIPGSPWRLVARMDLAEIYAPLREQLKLVIALITVLILAAGAGVGMVWRQQRVRFYRERYAAAEALRTSESRFRSTLDNMLEGCQTIGFDWRYLYINHAAAGHGRQTREELLGHTMLERYPGIENTEMFAVLRRCMEERASGFMENEFIYPDGSKAWFMLSIQPVPEGIFILSLDITERKRIEASLEQRAVELARSNAELEQFAYVASHDLQEPLRKVSSYVQLLARRYKGRLDSDADEFIGFAVEGAERMQKLIEDLLTFSRVGTRGKPFEPAESEEVLEKALFNLQGAIEETGAQITHDPLPAVQGDSSQLVQLFQNLIGNALKFRGAEAPRIHISAAVREKEWVFSVRDNGIGIDPRYFDRIFAVFQRLHPKEDYPGTGIGLSLCKKIVERHEGQIWIESEPGRGSTFYFSIPERTA